MLQVVQSSNPKRIPLSKGRHAHADTPRLIATMRTPDASIIPTVPNLELLQLDVADPASIAQAVAAAGEIVVLVNHAGIGWLNALEGTPMDAACGGSG
jgi:NAD(P)-dependent dehydrogenase (short-subunit alcohol dehydrogenase family)